MRNIRITSFATQPLSYLDFDEAYISPDLSYMSGITDYSTGLNGGEDVYVQSPYASKKIPCKVSADRVRRQGKVFIERELEVKTVKCRVSLPVKYKKGSSDKYYVLNNKNVDFTGGTEFADVEAEQKYVEYKGDISYFYESSDGSVSGYMVDHVFYPASFDDDKIAIRTFLWIEDGTVDFDGEIYTADMSLIVNNGAYIQPSIRKGVGFSVLKGRDYVPNTNIRLIANDFEEPLIKDYEPSKWKDVIKFKVAKSDGVRVTPYSCTSGGYSHYAVIGDESYQLDYVYSGESRTYVGYGVVYDNKFYEYVPRYVDEDVYSMHKDIPLSSGYVYNDEEDKSVSVGDTLTSVDHGSFMLLFSNENVLMVGAQLRADSISPITTVVGVVNESDEDGKSYECIYYDGKRYEFTEHEYDTVNVGGKEYRIFYTDDEMGEGYFVVDDSKIEIEISQGEKKAWPKKMLLFSDDEGATVNYGKLSGDSRYDVTVNKSVVVNGVGYIMQDKYDEENDIHDYYVEISEACSILFSIDDMVGSNMYVCTPLVDENIIDAKEIDTKRRNMVSKVVSDASNFTFTEITYEFGEKPFDVYTYLVESLSAQKPFTASDADDLAKQISIVRSTPYITISTPLCTNVSGNIDRELVVGNDFVDYVKSNSINDIVDMEKDIYYPSYEAADGSYAPIKEIRFNFHFRTRNLDSWKVYEDDRATLEGNDGNDSTAVEENSNYYRGYCNWFVTDYRYYTTITNMSEDGILSSQKGVSTSCHNTSDLMGLLGFTMNDIKNRASKISKSFVRLSFYSTNDPNTQMLLATSTIFLDENSIYKKYSLLNLLSGRLFANVQNLEDAGTQNRYTYTYEELMHTYYKPDEYGTKYMKFNYVVSNVISPLSETVNNYEMVRNSRIGSDVVVKNKYNSDISSEGYYLYMFKEYANGLRKRRIYLRIDFNHAGIGKSIPMALLRKRIDEDGVGTPLYIFKQDDLKELKNGIQMKDMYKQLHIPIDVVYDTATNKYVYMLPEQLRENGELGVDDNIMEFNLFEIKFANESL